jgi:hypothetical protein
MLKSTSKDSRIHRGVTSVTQFTTQLSVTQRSCPCVGKLFDIPFNEMFLHLNLANYLAPETIIRVDVKYVKTQLICRFGIHISSNLVSQLPKRLLCRSSSLALLAFFSNAFFMFLCLQAIVLCEMWVSPLEPCCGNFNFIKVTVRYFLGEHIFESRFCIAEFRSTGFDRHGLVELQSVYI